MKFEYIRYLNKLNKLKKRLIDKYNNIEYKENINKESCLLEIDLVDEMIDNLKVKIRNYGK